MLIALAPAAAGAFDELGFLGQRGVADALRSSIRALRRILEPAHVFTFVAGLSSAGVHLHQHIFTRPSGTAPEVPWHDANFPGAPRIPASELGALCAELAAELQD